MSIGLTIAAGAQLRAVLDVQLIVLHTSSPSCAVGVRSTTAPKFMPNSVKDRPLEIGMFRTEPSVTIGASYEIRRE